MPSSAVVFYFFRLLVDTRGLGMGSASAEIKCCQSFVRRRAGLLLKIAGMLKLLSRKRDLVAFVRLFFSALANKLLSPYVFFAFLDFFKS